MNKLTIIATSDLHGDLPDPKTMPEGDVLVLAGDLLPDDYWSPLSPPGVGSTRILRQAQWFDEVFIPWLPEVKMLRVDKKGKWIKRYNDIIFIGGNHDFALQAMLKEGIDKKLPKHVHYLSESSVVIDGIKFYGAGWNMTRGWAFCHDEEDHEEKLRYVPDDTDVMVIHGPPHIGAIDELAIHWCSPAIRMWLAKRKIKAYICGHIHEAFGEYKIGETPVYVVSRKDRMYRDVNPFVTIDIVK